MKLLKIIEILKDINNWDYREDSDRFIIHKPTGIYTSRGMLFCKDMEVVYVPNLLFTFITEYHVNGLHKTIKNINEKYNLDNIHHEWKLKFGNQSY